MGCLKPIGIGWDVGGWNCDKNSSSRDAIVIVDEDCRPIGKPWRGNLARVIAKSSNSEDFVRALFELCQLEPFTSVPSITIAVDAPLGFPTALIELVTHGSLTDVIGASSMNPYLFRFTERQIAQSGATPLSSVKDMIGSQSTKAIHAVRKFTPFERDIGVWTDGQRFTAIETYPAACRRNVPGIDEAVPVLSNAHVDIRDAGVCAVIAYWFQSRPEILKPPPSECPRAEGWIWLPTMCGDHKRH